MSNENSEKIIADLQRRLSITEKERDIVIALLTESDKVYYERLMQLESEVQVIQQGRLEYNDEFKKIYAFIREVQALKNRLAEREKVFSASIKKVEELSFHLSETDRVKSEFLANTSHEIRTPLNAILGYLELIKGGLYDTPEEMQEYVSGAIESAGHLLKLLNDILDIARIESGILKINFEEINIKMLIEAIYTSMQMQAYQKELNFDLELPEENIIVRADSDRLKQILQNLISNALKFTPRGGNVTVKITFLPEKNYVLCDIIDTGIGIDKDNIKKIFERFTQLDSGTTRKYQGAGLGLYITKSLIELMGGLIHVSSDGKDKGSQFSFTVPLALSDVDFNLNSPPNKDRFKVDGDPTNPLVAVILDDTGLRYELKSALLQNAYSVVSANTADDGFAILKELNPKLVIIDWALPRRKLFDLTNGIDLYKFIKSHPEYSSLPLLVLTGHPLNYIKLFEENLNIDDTCYFEKPVSKDKVLIRINELLHRTATGKQMVILLESDPKIYSAVKQLFASENYTLKVLYNSQDFLNYLSENKFKKAAIIMSQISAAVIDEDIYRLVLEKIPNHDYAVVIISHIEDYKFSENCKYIAGNNTFALLKKDFIGKPEILLDIVNKIK